MPHSKKSAVMAECLNFGNLDLTDNQDIRQAIMEPPMIRDMILQCIDFAVNPEKEKSEIMLKFHPDANEQKVPNPTNKIINLSECDEKTVECDFDEYEDSSDKTKKSFEQSCMPLSDSTLYFLPVNYNKRNPWRRTIGLHIFGHELRSSTYPARSSVKKLRFAQAKKPLNYLYSYFSVEVLDCDDESSITVGISRKDYPSKIAPGKNSGSVGYFSDSGVVSIRDVILLDGPRFSKGDVIGCGIIYPLHYKRYADLSTDDNSDGMTDVVLTSLLKTNAKSMDFVCNVLNLNNQRNRSMFDSESSSDEQTDTKMMDPIEYDYYNENFVESRTQVEVYFTHNMKVVGKVLSYVPVGGFYPTIHVCSTSAIKMNVDLNPPTS